MGRRALLAWCACLAACGGATPPAESTASVVVAWPQGATTLSPDDNLEEFTIGLQRNLYDTLIDSDGSALRPGLAESWATPDDHTWIFRLRRGVRLHDGRSLDASHVVACLQWAWTRQASASALPAVVSAEATDERTVLVRTQAPFATLAVRVAGVAIWAPPLRKGGAPVGSGPYRVVRFTPGGDAVLEAFEDHWRGAPSVRRLEFRSVPRVEERLRLLKKGEVQLVPDVPAGELASLARQPGLKTLARRGLRVVFLGMDQGASPFRDVAIRRAVRAAIDRPALVADALGGQAEAVAQIVAPEVFGHDSTLQALAADAEAARPLRAIGQRAPVLDLDFPTGKYRAIEAVAQRVAADLTAAGLPVRPRPRHWKEWDAARDRRELRLFLMGWMAVNDATASFEFLFHSPAGAFGVENVFGYANPEVDRLIEEAPQLLDASQRLEILYRVARRVHDDVPLVPLYRQLDLYATAANLRFEPRPDRVILGHALAID